jgi:hypothetical protein
MRESMFHTLLRSTRGGTDLRAWARSALQRSDSNWKMLRESMSRRLRGATLRLVCGFGNRQAAKAGPWA